MTQATGLKITDEGYQYVACGAGATTTCNGPVGGQAGDLLQRLIITVATAASAQTQIQDGANGAITILPNSPGGGVGVYWVEIGGRSTNGPWKIIVAAGSTVVAVGRFN